MATTASHNVICVLGTSTTTILTDGPYEMIGSLTLPNVGHGDTSNSQVVATLSRNGSTIYTGNAGATGFMVTGIQCVAGDTLGVQLSSGAAIDQPPNTIKCTLAIG